MIDNGILQDLPDGLFALFFNQKLMGSITSCDNVSKQANFISDP
jgi:hypothetical protein